MKEKLKKAINVLIDLEYDLDFRNMIDKEDKFQKFDSDMVLFIESLKAILSHKYGKGSIVEGGKNND